MINYPRLERKSATTLLVCALFAVSGPSNASAETMSPRYEMNAISDAAQGDRIMAGDYATAIRRIDVSKRFWLNRFYAATNLCVAYVLSRHLEDAADMCELSVAVIESRLAERSVNRHLARDREYLKFMAIALSNRGVLRALSGDKRAARDDFNAAKDVNSRLESPQANLARLAEDGAPSA